MRRCWLIFAVLVLMLAGCSAQNEVVSAEIVTDTKSTDEFFDEDFDLLEEELDEQQVDVPDPLEPVNRIMFGFNDVLYFWVVKPVAQGVKAVLPKDVRIGVRNFFDNITMPARFVNCHLQGKPRAADIELKRFWINTTEGILGFGDPATDKHNLEAQERDLGQTLGKAGLGNGFYLVLPLFGPSTLRDGVGLAGDQFLNPVRYVEPCEASLSISAGAKANEASFRIGEYESFKEEAIDPYVAMKEIYLQYRQKKLEE
jgi:phospholipid-binding lipoprotein MlaA